MVTTDIDIPDGVEGVDVGFDGGVGDDDSFDLI